MVRIPYSPPSPRYLIGHNAFTKAPVHLDEETLLRHLLVVGSSGSGKSRGVIENLIRQIALARPRRGCLFLDPHGSAYGAVQRWCASNPALRERVLFFDINDDEQFFGYNPLQPRPGLSIDDQVSGIIEAIKKVCGQDPEQMAPRFERWSRSLFWLAASCGLTFPELIYLLEDNEMRMALADRTDNYFVQSEWHGFEQIQRQTDRWNLLESVLNRLSKLVTQHSRNILGQPQTTIPLWEAMQEGKLILINLLPRRVSPELSRIIGTFITNDVLCLAKQREADSSRPFFFIVDEAAEFTSPDFARQLEQLRKFRVGCVLSVQELEQLRDDNATRLYDAAMTNTETKLIFSVSHRDAAELVGELFAGKIRGDRVKRENYRTMFSPHESRRRVVQRSEMTAQHEAEGSSDMASWAEGSATGTSSGHSLPDFGMCNGVGFTGDSSGHQHSSGGGQASSRMRGESRANGRSQADVPFYEFVREQELGGVDYFSTEEQKAKFISWMVNQRQRHFQFKMRGHSPILLRAPEIPDAIASGRMLRLLDERSKRLCRPPSDVQALLDRRYELLKDYTNETSLRQLKEPEGGDGDGR